MLFEDNGGARWGRCWCLPLARRRTADPDSGKPGRCGLFHGVSKYDGENKCDFLQNDEAQVEITCEKGLTFTITGKNGSEPYVKSWNPAPSLSTFPK